MVPNENGVSVEKFVQVGIVSYGEGCAEPFIPGYVFISFIIIIIN